MFKACPCVFLEEGHRRIVIQPLAKIHFLLNDRIGNGDAPLRRVLGFV